MTAVRPPQCSNCIRMESSLKAAMLAQPQLRKFVDIFTREGVHTWVDAGLLTDVDLKQDLSMNLIARKALRAMLQEQLVRASNFQRKSQHIYSSRHCLHGKFLVVLQ